MSRGRLPEPTPLSPRQLIAEVEWLHANHVPAWKWAAQLNVSVAALEQTLRRAKRDDLSNTLDYSLRKVRRAA